ncbi:MAG: hypothetical protein K2J13_05240 [Clostridia bacterium]|nr:hypothetical protein [Clostridia bacterium]
MPTSIANNYHFMAKLAKNRMLKDPKNKGSFKERINSDIDTEFYYNVVKISLSAETIYNPISILVGKDLKQVPNSCEKQRTVFQVIKKFDEARALLKKELLLAAREKRNFELRDISVDPMEALCKL